ncbi:MAG: DNA internalization-related competence protein ComEC/Rec2 [Oscillospiraceae bacterium]|nr:DNA internalization-related competence protein ComEC/Rec2 [Oscillospiraceae bacterium]
MRKLALFVLGFTAAILLSQYFLIGTIELIVAGISAVVALAALFVKKRPATMAGIIALGITIGSMWNYAYDYFYFDHAEAMGSYSGEVSAVAVDYPTETDYGSKVEIKIQFERKPSVKAMLYSFGSVPDIRPGDMIRFEGTLKLAAEKTENDYFASKGIPLFAYADSEILIDGTVENAALKYFHKNFAKLVKEKIAAIFPDFAVPFMTAILSGDRTLLDEETYVFSTLATTGAAHIVAVSGMHVAFLVGLLQLLLGKRSGSNIVCIPIIIVFMAMTGFAASVVRAGIMQIVMLCGAILRRDYDDITSLSVALLILLAINPVSVKNGGLQLSFAATFGIILFGNKVYSVVSAPFAKGKKLHHLYKNAISRKVINFVCASVASSFGALIFTLPITAVMFGYVSVIAPLMNIIILWAVTLAFSIGILVVIVGFIFAPVGAVIAWVPAVLSAYIARAASLLSKLPFAAVYTTSTYIRIWLVFMYAQVALFCFIKCRGKLLVFIASNILVLSCCIGLSYKESAVGDLTVSVLNVGQGQSVLLASEGKSVIVDCGGSLGTNAGDIAAEQLAAVGENHLDAIILTHFHDDHANGVIELMRRVSVDKLIAPMPDAEDEFGAYVLEFANEKGIEVITVTYADYIYDFGLAECTIMPPLGAHNDNEKGLAIVVTSGKFDAVITGDMSGDTEYRLIEYADLPDAELLVVGHHGSRYSTSEALIEAVKPEIAAISVGINSYGHPSEHTLLRLEAAGVSVYRTDENGMVTVKFGEKEDTDG